MKRAPFKILFLCTGNSARSILAEYLANHFAGDKLFAVSAGSHPKPAPHPLALRTLQEKFGIDASGARSKSWEDFRDETFDFVITLCDNAKESCPVWVGQPVIAHWGSPDPAAYEGSDEERANAFWQVAQQIRRRLELFWSLPLEKLDALRLQTAAREIGAREVIEITPYKTSL